MQLEEVLTHVEFVITCTYSSEIGKLICSVKTWQSLNYRQLCYH